MSRAKFGVVRSHNETLDVVFDTISRMHILSRELKDRTPRRDRWWLVRLRLARWGGSRRRRIDESSRNVWRRGRGPARHCGTRTTEHGVILLLDQLPPLFVVQ